jgi:hypothetical protein
MNTRYKLPVYFALILWELSKFELYQFVQCPSTGKGHRAWLEKQCQGPDDLKNERDSLRSPW